MQRAVKSARIKVPVVTSHCDRITVIGVGIRTPPKTRALSRFIFIANCRRTALSHRAIA
jgi:hypothetical protein